MKRMLMIVVCMVIPMVASAGEGDSTVVNIRVPEFTLQDQYDKPVTSRQWEGRNVVLIASDKKGSEQNPEWKKALSAQYGDRIVLQGVADVRTVPFFLKSSIRKDFQKDKESILLDWDGVIFTSLDLKKSASNLVVIDKKGMVKHIQSGPAEPAAVSRLFSEIDKVAK